MGGSTNSCDDHAARSSAASAISEGELLKFVRRPDKYVAPEPSSETRFGLTKVVFLRMRMLWEEQCRVCRKSTEQKLRDLKPKMDALDKKIAWGKYQSSDKLRQEADALLKEFDALIAKYSVTCGDQAAYNKLM